MTSRYSAWCVTCLCCSILGFGLTWYGVPDAVGSPCNTKCGTDDGTCSLANVCGCTENCCGGGWPGWPTCAGQCGTTKYTGALRRPVCGGTGNTQVATINCSSTQPCVFGTLVPLGSKCTLSFFGNYCGCGFVACQPCMLGKATIATSNTCQAIACPEYEGSGGCF